MSDLTLYLAPGTCAMAVHIALTEAQAQGSNCAVNGGLTADGQFQVLTTRPLARPTR